MSKPLQDYSREELIAIIDSLKKQKKFGLVWEDKPEKVAEECKSKMPVVEEIVERGLKLAEGAPTNLIIEGDNYHALSVLNYTYAGKIDVIYIDPPYNTGKKDEWKYNDRWVDENDTYRHSKWLSFMQKRLQFAKDLLCENGVIFISIDDKEHSRLKVLCDEIFLEKNFHGTVTWIKRTKPTNMGSAKYSLQSNTEYVIVYGRKPQDRHNYILPKLSSKEYPDVDDNGRRCRIVSVDQRKNLGSMARPTMVYEVLGISPKDGYRWQLSPKERDKLLARDALFVKNGKLYQRVYEEDEKSGDSLEPFWSHRQDTGTAESAKEDLERLLKEDDVFDTVKPTELLRQLLLFSSKKDAIILDFFAGSGTTGQAVLELNKEDGGSRQFILCTNNENKIAEKVTYPRIKTVITGKRADGSAYSEGIPANLRYFKTDFVDKERSTDATRKKLVDRSADMIRIRENAYQEILSGTINNKYFLSDSAFVAIIFDPFEIAEAWAEIEKLDTEKKLVKLYIFSYSRDTSAFTDEIPETELEWESVPIPESILSVYKRLFGGRR